MKKWLPLILAALMAAWFLGTLRPPRERDFAYTDFGKLPVLYNGRLKPMDSLARNSLLQLREKQTLNLEPWKEWYQHPKIVPAIEWLTTVMMNPAVADQWPVFRIDNPEVVALLKLPGKDPAEHQDGKHYSWAQIKPALDALNRETTRILQREENKESDTSQRTPFERAVIKMHERRTLYLTLENTLEPEGVDDWAQALTLYEASIPSGVTAIQAQQAKKPYDQAAADRLAGFVQAFDAMDQYEPPLVVPPAQAPFTRDRWFRSGHALVEALRDGKIPAPVKAYATMSGAMKTGDFRTFNQAVVEYRASLAQDFSGELKKCRSEVFFNRMEPFYAAMTIYVLAGLLAGLFWFNLSEPLRRSAVWLIVLGFVIHTTGLVFRMWLEGRPPVTNLYSSAIFIGWGAVVLGFILERFHKNGIGAVVGSCIGFVTLIIAHHLSMEGDTMEMMRAVLDTNFWLATHVVVVTLGYASTFVAGFLALIYVLRGVFTKTLDAATGKSLARMIYGIVCFATLFSFVGTVLGGIWADQSWGRFWGWDPKENGALIIVLWNALILHLRWGGMVRERGLAVCAVAGNIVTSWSWFGVNMLGIGLHSYGFMDAAFKWLMLFVGSQICLIIIGCLPLHLWKSFQGTRRPEAMSGGEPAPAA
jgi:ABC-type transport system involved in cytochrome c biogenesis permease subunit